MTKSRGWLKSITFTLGPLICLFLIGEVASRAKLALTFKDTGYLISPFGRSKPNDAKDVYRVDRVERVTVGYEPKERGGGSHYYYKLPPGVGEPPSRYTHHYTINSLGFRGREFSPIKSPGTTRVFAIGDSSTFGAESPDDQTWPARLEHHLARLSPAMHAEVINAGFLTYNTLYCLNLIRHELIDYHPDIFVIYAGYEDLFFPGNFARRVVAMERLHNALYYRYSMLYTLATEKLAVMLRHTVDPDALTGDQVVPHVQQNLQAIIDVARQRGVRVVIVREVVLAPKEVMARDDATLEEYREAFQKPENASLVRDHKLEGIERVIYRMDRLYAMIRGLSQRNGVDFWDFRDTMARQMSQGESPFVDFLHLTSFGNDLLASLIADRLSNQSR